MISTRVIASTLLAAIGLSTVAGAGEALQSVPGRYTVETVHGGISIIRIQYDTGEEPDTRPAEQTVTVSLSNTSSPGNPETGRPRISVFREAPRWHGIDWRHSGIRILPTRRGSFQTANPSGAHFIGPGEGR